VIVAQRGRARGLGLAGQSYRLRLLLSLMLVFSSVARADPVAAAQARLQEGLRRYDAQEYKKAVELLTQVTRDASAPRALRARAYEALGMALLILGKQERAREAFEDLLAIDPGYKLSDPSRSPKLREFFETVRRAFVPGYAQGAAEAELEHAAPTGATAGRPIELDATAVSGARAVALVVLHWRRQGLLGYRAQPMNGAGGGWQANLTMPEETTDYVFEYYLEGLDGKNRVVARVGSPEAPLALSVKGAPPVVPWFRRWWVWTLAASVLAASATIGIGVGLGVSANRAPEGSLGHVNLGIRF